MDNKKEGKVGIEFYCELCNVKCRDNYNFKKHLDTNKHKWITMDNKKEGSYFICECGKYYKYNSGLSKHKKKCNHINNQIIQANKNHQLDTNNHLINLVEEQNKKFKELEDIIKCTSINQITNNTTNNTTNNFNLNIFLNEKCKDSINILEFKKEVLKSITDISNVLNISNQDGIINAVNITYNKLDNYEKPYYSLDKSRKQVIVKNDKNEWVKDREIIYDIVQPLEHKYNSCQLDNFYKNVIDKDNMNDKQEREFTCVLLNTTREIDKERFLKDVINNGANPKII
jgi:hypothetical protein|tara:strand:+ start:7649 stop:8506 length:858 start_codon:yes stop_codon:yes gene_type:complete